MQQSTSSILSQRQRSELNRSILAYLLHNNVPSEVISNIHDIIDPSSTNVVNGGIVDSDEIRKHAQVLEKKWTSVVRLQRKVLDLESQVSTLKEELDTLSSIGGGLTSKNSKRDVALWLPRSPAKYTLSGHRQPITALAFHPFFSLLGSSSEDGTIKIWDWELGELEKTIKAHTKSVLDIDFGGPSNDEILLASCSSDLTIKLWDPSNDYSNIKTLTGHDHTISSIRFTPSGTHLISGSRDKTIRIWDVKTGYSIRTIHGHSEWIKSICPSLDNNYILSGSIDQTARISNFTSGEGKLQFIGHDHVIEFVTFAPKTAYPYLAAIEGIKQPINSQYSSSFEYIATASRDKTIKIWNTRQEVILTLIGHDNWVRALEFHPGGKYLLSVSDDRTIRCWDLTQQGRCVKVIQEAHHHFISCIRWAPPIMSINEDTKSDTNTENNNMRCLIATGSVDLEIKLWT